MATFPAFLDTCTLYGLYLCGTRRRLAEADAFRPLWSAGVLGERERNLIERGLPKSAYPAVVSDALVMFGQISIIGDSAAEGQPWSVVTSTEPLVIIAEPQWTPAIEEQAIARCHRTGQVHPPTAKG